MGGFAYAGSLANSAPVERVLEIGETCYTGQMLMWGGNAVVADALGDVVVLDPAAQDSEDDHPVAGCCTSVYTTNDAGFSGVTGYGDTATYDAKAAQLLNDPIGQTKVKVTIAIPHVTLFGGPVYNGAYGTALTELVVTTANSGGTTAAHANQTAIDIEDDFGVMYCRKGENAGHYRQIATAGTASQVAGVAFPYGIAVGDVFVSAPGVPGNCGLNIGGTANYINGASPTNTNVFYYGVYLHVQDLEVSGKENYVFAFLSSACGTVGFQGL